MREENTWFESWFNTPYYHILYKERDDTEAQVFIDHLIEYFRPDREAKMMDLACGRGRHAIYLNSKGFDVVGIDLSSESVYEAKKSENEHLHFIVHDMREPYPVCCFDYIFNLFTSFGYFHSDEDDQKTIDAISQTLQPGGTFLIDFMNVKKVMMNLVEEEQKNIQGIVFHIRRFLKDDFIVKEIRFYR